MLHSTARILEPLLRLFWPPRGRHRSPVVNPAPPPYSPRPVHAPDLVVPGELSPLVRPYLVAYELREEARRQRARRRALWLAVRGIDIGPRLIHGVEVTA
ncbi:hypothetical protein ACIQ7Q_12975 [Streptomyces sp. NPDC096176]|uniref:hypothetical protein n=1 Tax=Streptomyces sp. NPDC096176 TaxID=3366079 RepID=UPI0037F1B483